MRKVTFLLFILLCISSTQAERFYVDTDAASGGNGQDWASAFRYLQDALDQTVAGRGDEVWIAEGTYYPSQGSNVNSHDRTATFVLKDGIALYGGFQGNETELSQRDIASHESILSGNIDPRQIYWALHVCTINEDSSVTLDGLTVRDGNANGTSNNRGGAIHVSSETTSRIAVATCVFVNNSAAFGGVASGGDWTVTDSTFSGNSATTSGGVASLGTWTVTDSTFNGNSAINQGGVAGLGTWTVTGSTFSNNSADQGGVAYDGSWTVTDSTFSGNSADRGGVAFGSVLANRTVTGCIFANNWAEGEGGVAEGGSWIVTDSAFNNNGAVNRGGVAIIGTWDVTGSTFSGNSAAGAGGVAYDGIWTVMNSTFSGNKANYAGLASYGSWTLLHSIIDALNVTTNLPYQFANLNSFQNFVTPDFPVPFTPLAKNIIQGGTSVIQAQTLDVFPSFIIDADPLFLNPSDPGGPDDLFGTPDDGLRLQAGSPAIGEGDVFLLPEDASDLDNDGITNEPLPLDRAGFLRVQFGGLDLGAYAFVDNQLQVFSLTVLSDGDGSVLPRGSQNHPELALETLTATPNPGYLFDQWSGSVISSVNPLRITIVTNLTITASFTPDLNDSDEDGLSNFDEIVTYGTDPNNGDTSGDGLLDGYVVNAGADPNVNYAGVLALVQSAAIATITNNPTAYNLYTESSIQDLNMGGLIVEQDAGTVQLEWTIETWDGQSTNGWQVYEQIIRSISMPGDKHFMRVRAGAAE